MKKTLIYYDHRYETTARMIMKNYTEHGHYAEMICMIIQDDIEYARENGFDEAICIETEHIFTCSDLRHGYVSDFTLNEIMYRD